MNTPGALSRLQFAFEQTDPGAKCAAVLQLVPFDDSSNGSVCNAIRPLPYPHPGRPDRPELISPRDVPTRGLGTSEGRAALVHAVAHIEFNAINLALDASLRFVGMPVDYYNEWLSVAQDEARHFMMLRRRLQMLGRDYGDFSAHNGLWEAAQKTADDVLARMALVPRVLEARGLDVTPGMINRLREVGDHETVAVLQVILDEEVRHVAIGTKWFRWLCEQRNLDPGETFKCLLEEHGARIRPPINWAARQRAGFERSEIPTALLTDISSSH